MKQPSCVIILFSIHFVLKAEKLLLTDNVIIDVIPVPRDISSDCGMAIEFSCKELERVQNVLTGGGISIARIFRRENNGDFTKLSCEDG